MRLAIVLIFFISSSVSAIAKCGGNGIYLLCSTNGIYPLSKGPSLNKNGLMILEFYALSQSIIPNLNKKFPIYLESNGQKTTLQVLEVLKGEMAVTQVILKPEQGLSEYQTYELHIGNLPKDVKEPIGFSLELKTWGPIRFTFTNTSDNVAPDWICPPREINKSVTQYGCGPAIWVEFEVSAIDESEIFVRAMVKNKLTGVITNYILAIEDGHVKVGHGMCSGPFKLQEKVDYEVTFQLMDQYGHKSESSQTIAFTAPTDIEK